jgi:hypothetical protein
MLPSAAHARRVIWDSINHDGVRMIDAVFPPEIRAGEANEQQMRIRLKNGSSWALGGADYFNAMVGANPVGITFSEAALMDLRAWSYFRPILAQNKGWAAFIGTPRGIDNHFFELRNIARREPGWYESSIDAIEAGIMSEEDIAREISSGMPEELARQEYRIDFSAANVGSILGRYIEQAENQGRIVDHDLYDPAGAPVEVAADLGSRDASAFWWWQPKYDGYAILDHDEDVRLDVREWAERLRGHPYEIGTLWLPHDARARTLMGKSLFEQFAQEGFRVRVGAPVAVADRINAARGVLPRCQFLRAPCERGLAALRSWCFEWDEERRVMSTKPRHDLWSDSADAFTYLAVAAKVREREFTTRPPAARTLGSFTLDELWETRDVERRIRP